MSIGFEPPPVSDAQPECDLPKAEPVRSPLVSKSSDKSSHDEKNNRLKSVVVSAAVIVVVVLLASRLSRTSKVHDTYVLQNVEKRDLVITVTERGNLESQDNVRVICEVDDISGDGIHGTPILWVVDNGASVKKGDLIVELDYMNHQNRLDNQILEVEEEQADYIQAKVSYENQKTQNVTNLQQADLEVKLAKLALEQFGDEEGGTYQIDLQNVELQIEEAKASQLIEKTNLSGVERLYKLGYRSSAELAQARLTALKSEREFATSLSRKQELVKYTFQKSRLELQGALDSAIQNRKQIELNNQAELEQARARMESADEQLKKEKELLERYKNDVKNCRIYAEQDGMIAYSTGTSRYNRQEIREGAPVRPRQEILTLPNLKRMQVKTSIHETVLDQVKQGLDVTVRVDAFPDENYSGSVKSVAVLPDQSSWYGSDTKVYATVVTIDQDVRLLKPGMTAVVEIHVDKIENVVAVPIQAINQQNGETFCYVYDGQHPERRIVETGATNDKHVEIVAGLSPGEQIILNPNAVEDQMESNEASEPEKQPEETT